MRLGILLLLLSAPLLAQKRAITFDDYIALKAVSDAQLSPDGKWVAYRSEEHTSELQSQSNLVCRLLLEKKNKCHISFSHPQYTFQHYSHYQTTEMTRKLLQVINPNPGFHHVKRTHPFALT